jgi:hypothetical protein
MATNTKQALGVVVGSSATEVLRIGTSGMKRVAFHVSNRAGGAALTATSIRGRAGGGSGPVPATQAFPDVVLGTNPAATTYPIVGSANASATLAANAAEIFVVNCEGLREVSLRLTCGTSTTVDVAAHAVE